MQPYINNGVKISKTAIKEGDEVTLSYEGFLAKNGASKVYAHVGYGDAWDSKDNIPMSFEKGVFKADLKVKKSSSLNICFKDDNDNWDNNSFNNYSFKIAQKAAATASKTETKTGAKVAKSSSSSSEAVSVAKKTTTKAPSAKKSK